MNALTSWSDIADLEPKNDANNLMLVDGNNLAYRWVQRKNYDNFGQEYISTVQSLAKSYNAKRTIICFDFGKSYYRMEAFEHYKAHRKKPSDPDEAKKYDEFFECLNATIETLPIENYKYRGVEADDLLAFFTEHLTNKYEYTWIISSDRDIYQLLNEKVNIFNLYSRKEISEDSLLEEKGATPQEYLLAKIIQGDSGDNIPGIDGIGEIRSLALAREYKDIPTLMQALPIKRKAQYIQNLNQGRSTILINDKLMNLKKHYEEAIKCGKDGGAAWILLKKAVEQYNG